MNIAQKAFHALFSPPRSIPKPDNEDYNKSSANTRSARTSPRCQFTFSDGRQCRSQRAQFCMHHNSKQREFGAAGAPDAGLEALCGDLTTATNINRALAQVFLLMAQGRIPQKQAVAFGYLSQLLLQTVPGIRSEFVSAFGYHPWEEKLKKSLEQNENEDPRPPGGENNSTPGEGQPGIGVLEREKDASSRESPRGERHGDQESRSRGIPEEVAGLSRVNKVTPPFSPEKVNKARLSERSLREGLTPSDYESLLNRSLDMFAGKYSTTPEGRREERALHTELQLMEPPASKPPKGVRASVIEHMKRWIARPKAPGTKGNDLSLFPSVNFYGNPIKLAVPWDEPQAASPLPAKVYPPPRKGYPQDALFAGNKVELSPVHKVSRETSPAPSLLKSEIPNTKSPLPASPAAPHASSPASLPAAASAAPSNLPPPPVARSEPSPASPINKPEAPDYALPAMAAKQAAPPPVRRVPPTRPTPAAPRPEADPELPETKASLWDGRWRPPMPLDPIRHRATAFERELRSMSNAGWRRWQHQNSRCF